MEVSHTRTYSRDCAQGGIEAMESDAGFPRSPVSIPVPRGRASSWAGSWEIVCLVNELFHHDLGVRLNG